MNHVSHYSFDFRQVRLILPHRAPMLHVDGVSECSPCFSRIEAYKSVSGADPMITRTLAGSAFFPPTLMIEALAQTCGLLMNLRWLATQAIDVAAFADGDDHAVAETYIPHSVLAETRARQSRFAWAGDRLTLVARVTLQRGQMVRFAAQASGTDGECSNLEVVLDFPDYTLRHAMSLQKARAGC